MSAPLEAIRWAPGPKRLALLDQRLLPGTMEYIDIAGADEAWTAIKVRRGRRSWEDG
jgi:methylthioribose-1-phosphate isomerase